MKIKKYRKPTFDNLLKKNITKVSAVILSFTLVIFPAQPYVHAERTLEIPVQAEQTYEEALLEGDGEEGSSWSGSTDFLQVGALTTADESDEGVRGAEKSLDYAMAQAGEGVSIFELVDVKTLTTNNLKDFRSRTDVEHGLYFVDTGDDIKALYISSGDDDLIRTRRDILPYLENVVAGFHNHPDGVNLPGPTDLNNEWIAPQWEAVGTADNAWTFFDREGETLTDISDQTLLERVINMEGSDDVIGEGESALRDTLNLLLANLDHLQEAQASLGGNNEGVVLQAEDKPTVTVANGDPAKTHKLTFNFENIPADAKKVSFAINSTNADHFSSLVDLSASTTVDLLEIQNRQMAEDKDNFINIWFHNEAGERIAGTFMFKKVFFDPIPRLHINANDEKTRFKNIHLGFKYVPDNAAFVKVAVNSTNTADYGDFLDIDPNDPSIQGHIMELQSNNQFVPKEENFVNVLFFDADKKFIPQSFTFDKIVYDPIEVTINGGAETTASGNVSLSFNADGLDEVAFLRFAINTADLNRYGDFVDYTPNPTVSIPRFAGRNYVNVLFYNADKKLMGYGFDSIVFEPGTNGNTIVVISDTERLVSVPKDDNDPNSVDQVFHEFLDADGNILERKTYESPKVLSIEELNDNITNNIAKYVQRLFFANSTNQLIHNIEDGVVNQTIHAVLDADGNLLSQTVYDGEFSTLASLDASKRTQKIIFVDDTNQLIQTIEDGVVTQTIHTVTDGDGNTISQTVYAGEINSLDERDDAKRTQIIIFIDDNNQLIQTVNEGVVTQTIHAVLDSNGDTVSQTVYDGKFDTLAALDASKRTQKILFLDDTNQLIQTIESGVVTQTIHAVLDSEGNTVSQTVYDGEFNTLAELDAAKRTQRILFIDDTNQLIQTLDQGVVTQTIHAVLDSEGETLSQTVYEGEFNTLAALDASKRTQKIIFVDDTNQLIQTIEEGVVTQTIHAVLDSEGETLSQTVYEGEFNTLGDLDVLKITQKIIFIDEFNQLIQTFENGAVVQTIHAVVDADGNTVSQTVYAGEFSNLETLDVAKRTQKILFVDDTNQLIQTIEDGVVTQTIHAVLDSEGETVSQTVYDGKFDTLGALDPLKRTQKILFIDDTNQLIQTIENGVVTQTIHAELNAEGETVSQTVYEGEFNTLAELLNDKRTQKILFVDETNQLIQTIEDGVVTQTIHALLDSEGETLSQTVYEGKFDTLAALDNTKITQKILFIDDTNQLIQTFEDGVVTQTIHAVLDSEGETVSQTVYEGKFDTLASLDANKRTQKILFIDDTNQLIQTIENGAVTQTIHAVLDSEGETVSQTVYDGEFSTLASLDANKITQKILFIDDNNQLIQTFEDGVVTQTIHAILDSEGETLSQTVYDGKFDTLGALDNTKITQKILFVDATNQLIQSYEDGVVTQTIHAVLDSEGETISQTVYDGKFDTLGALDANKITQKILFINANNQLIQTYENGVVTQTIHAILDAEGETLSQTVYEGEFNTLEALQNDKRTQRILFIDATNQLIQTIEDGVVTQTIHAVLDSEGETISQTVYDGKFDTLGALDANKITQKILFVDATNQLIQSYEDGAVTQTIHAVLDSEGETISQTVYDGKFDTLGALDANKITQKILFIDANNQLIQSFEDGAVTQTIHAILDAEGETLSQTVYDGKYDTLESLPNDKRTQKILFIDATNQLIQSFEDGVITQTIHAVLDSEGETISQTVYDGKFDTLGALDANKITQKILFVDATNQLIQSYEDGAVTQTIHAVLDSEGETISQTVYDGKFDTLGALDANKITQKILFINANNQLIQSFEDGAVTQTIHAILDAEGETLSQTVYDGKYDTLEALPTDKRTQKILFIDATNQLIQSFEDGVITQTIHAVLDSEGETISQTVYDGKFDTLGALDANKITQKILFVDATNQLIQSYEDGAVTQTIHAVLDSEGETISQTVYDGKFDTLGALDANKITQKILFINANNQLIQSFEDGAVTQTIHAILDAEGETLSQTVYDGKYDTLESLPNDKRTQKILFIDATNQLIQSFEDGVITQTIHAVLDSEGETISQTVYDGKFDTLGALDANKITQKILFVDATNQLIQSYEDGAVTQTIHAVLDSEGETISQTVYDGKFDTLGALDANKITQKILFIDANNQLIQSFEDGAVTQTIHAILDAEGETLSQTVYDGKYDTLESLPNDKRTQKILFIDATNQLIQSFEDGVITQTIHAVLDSEGETISQTVYDGKFDTLGALDANKITQKILFVDATNQLIQSYEDGAVTQTIHAVLDSEGETISQTVYDGKFDTLGALDANKITQKILFIDANNQLIQSFEDGAVTQTIHAILDAEGETLSQTVYDGKYDTLEALPTDKRTQKILFIDATNQLIQSFEDGVITQTIHAVLDSEGETISQTVYDGKFDTLGALDANKITQKILFVDATNQLIQSYEDGAVTQTIHAVLDSEGETISQTVYDGKFDTLGALDANKITQKILFINANNQLIQSFEDGAVTQTIHAILDAEGETLSQTVYDGKYDTLESLPNDKRTQKILFIDATNQLIQSFEDGVITQTIHAVLDSEGETISQTVYDGKFDTIGALDANKITQKIFFIDATNQLIQNFENGSVDQTIHAILDSEGETISQTVYDGKFDSLGALDNNKITQRILFINANNQLIHNFENGVVDQTVHAILDNEGNTLSQTVYDGKFDTLASLDNTKRIQKIIFVDDTNQLIYNLDENGDVTETIHAVLDADGNTLSQTVYDGEFLTIGALDANKRTQKIIFEDATNQLIQNFENGAVDQTVHAVLDADGNTTMQTVYDGKFDTVASLDNSKRVQKIIFIDATNQLIYNLDENGDVTETIHAILDADGNTLSQTVYDGEFLTIQSLDDNKRTQKIIFEDATNQLIQNFEAGVVTQTVHAVLDSDGNTTMQTVYEGKFDTVASLDNSKRIQKIIFVDATNQLIYNLDDNGNVEETIHAILDSDGNTASQTVYTGEFLTIAALDNNKKTQKIIFIDDTNQIIQNFEAGVFESTIHVLLDSEGATISQTVYSEQYETLAQLDPLKIIQKVLFIDNLNQLIQTFDEGAITETAHAEFDADGIVSQTIYEGRFDTIAALDPLKKTSKVFFQDNGTQLIQAFEEGAVTTTTHVVFDEEGRGRRQDVYTGEFSTIASLDQDKLSQMILFFLTGEIGFVAYDANLTQYQYINADGCDTTDQYDNTTVFFPVGDIPTLADFTNALAGLTPDARTLRNCPS